jgi:hypothetical protein
VHVRLAVLALERGDGVMADWHVTESLIIAQDTALERALPFAETPLPEALEVRAALAAAQDAPQRALRLGGAAAALRAQLHQPLAVPAEEMLERRLAPPAWCLRRMSRPRHGLKASE